MSRVPAPSLRGAAAPCGCGVSVCGSSLRLSRLCMWQRLAAASSLHEAVPCQRAGGSALSARRGQRLVSAQVSACRRRWRKVRWRKVCPFSLAAWQRTPHPEGRSGLWSRARCGHHRRRWPVCSARVRACGSPSFVCDLLRTVIADITITTIPMVARCNLTTNIDAARCKSDSTRLLKL